MQYNDFYNNLPVSGYPCCVPFWERCAHHCCCERRIVDIRFGAFTPVKRDRATGAPLAGAVFTLTQGGRTVATSVSDADGLLRFPTLAPGTYVLAETSAPEGFAPDPAQRVVSVDIDGNVSVNGITARGYSLYNDALPALSFLKTDAAIGAPLPGAVFTLSTGVAATSDAAGRVNFGALAPGTYTMAETEAPEGYDRILTAFTVAVAEDGTVTIDGTPISGFTVRDTPLPASPRPAITAVRAGDATVSGTGTPGATVTVTFPNGAAATATVDETGAWQAAVPPGTTLAAGETVRASQTVAGERPSEEASYLVQA